MYLVVDIIVKQVPLVSPLILLQSYTQNRCLATKDIINMGANFNVSQFVMS